MDDASFMRRCLELAAKGRGKVQTNPLVGAVLVRDGEIIAEDWHKGFGELHAERALLETFEGDIQPDDILYLNLEPCCHKGKTPPCTDIIIEKGVKNLVYGMGDPNPLVAGKGIHDLQEAGVAVRGPVLRVPCEQLNRGFTSFIRKGRPWITLKMARTKDGKIANEDGSSLKITSEEQDRWSHEYLRATHDAILVGVQTIIADDPALTLRLNKKVDQFNPLRIVLDPDLRVPIEAQVIEEGTLIVTASSERKKELKDRGVRILEVPMKDDHFVWKELWEGLEGVASILVEGGPKTWETFKEAGMVDEEITLVGA